MSRTEVIVVGIAVAIAAALFFASQVMAGGKHTHTVPDPVVTTTSIENYSITEGVSNTDLARGVAMAGAQHNFDFSTTDWQLGVSGANYESEAALSLGVAKRFGDNAWIPNILLHGSFSTTGSSDELITFGAVFRL